MADAGVPLTTYRPMPADFPEKYAELGWDAVCPHYRVKWTTMKRWMIDFGEEELRERRRAWLEARYGERGHRIGGVKPGLKSKAARYVMGRTRSAVNVRDGEE